MRLQEVAQGRQRAFRRRREVVADLPDEPELRRVADAAVDVHHKGASLSSFQFVEALVGFLEGLLGVLLLWLLFWLGRAEAGAQFRVSFRVYYGVLQRRYCGECEECSVHLIWHRCDGVLRVPQSALRLL